MAGESRGEHSQLSSGNLPLRRKAIIMAQQPFFTIYNGHVEQAGTPPQLDSREPGTYFGYFENEHGEQWVFVYDHETERGVLQGGDAGWAEKFEVVDGTARNLILNSEERQWLLACWKAATAFKEARKQRRDRA
jgi:hypothetical protein